MGWGGGGLSNGPGVRIYRKGKRFRIKSAARAQFFEKSAGFI